MKKFLKRLAILAGIAALGYLTYFGVAVAGIMFFPEVMGTCLTAVKIISALALTIGGFCTVKKTLQDIKDKKQEQQLETALYNLNQKNKKQQKSQQRTNVRQAQYQPTNQQKRWVGRHRTKYNNRPEREAA